MKKLSLFSLLTVFLISLLAAGQGNALRTDDKAEKPCQAKIIKCPVDGKVISKDARDIKTEYQGKTYYFCCEKCQAEFAKNPEKYARACSCKAMYVCPMKECNYKSDKPGKCPKCGMELKKVKCECHHTKAETKCAEKDKPEKK